MTLLDKSPATAEAECPILFAGDPGWDEARSNFNLLVDQQPAAVALPTTERGVANAVSYARQQGWRVAAQGTGHNAAPLGDLTGTLLLNTSKLIGVRIDAAARRVRVGAATCWSDVVPQLSDLGLAALHGSSPDVGIVGYTLGGGLSWLGRTYGLASNAVTAIELVTAEGHLVRADANHEPDLFWALRGANGSYGVVTALEFEVVGVQDLYAGALFFPVERAGAVLGTWNGLLDGFPEELTTWATILHLPPLPEIPDPLRGKSFVIVLAAFLGAEDDGRALLAPLRELGPVMDSFAMVPPAGLGPLAMDPTDPAPYQSTSALLDDLSPDTLEGILQVAGHPGPLMMVQLRHLGGAFSRAPLGGGSRAAVAGELSLYAIGMVPVPQLQAPVSQALAALTSVVAPHAVGSFPSFVETPADSREFWDDATWSRLRQVKSLYDPQDVFLANHPIPLAG